MLQAKNIHFEYPQGKKFVFPDLEVKNQSSLLILGDSGCGKTTWLHILAGILQPKQGELLLNNEPYPIKELDHFRGNHIGIVFQESHFIKSLNVRENIRLPWAFQPRKKDEAHYDQILKQLDIQDIAYQKINDISTGQQQRVNIARALINKPEIILADEPTSNLDDTNATSVIQLLKDVSTAHGCSLIIVTHDSRLKTAFKNQIAL